MVAIHPTWLDVDSGREVCNLPDLQRWSPLPRPIFEHFIKLIYNLN